MMQSLIAKFPEQLNEALEIGSRALINSHGHEIRQVYVAGLGGSGIGADLVADFIYNECSIPFIVGKSYSIPKYVDKYSLVIFSSFSGNTEETLEALSHTLLTGAKVVCIASGGQLIAKAKELGLDYIVVPSTYPSPRASLGYSMVQQLFILHKLNLISIKTIDAIRSAANLIKFDQDEIRAVAQQVALKLKNKLPVIYTTDRTESVATRLRQQLNENAKTLCWHHVIPEMNHNELTGWSNKHPDLAVILLRNKDDHKRNQLRIEINKSIIGRSTSHIIELYSKGTSLVEKCIYFVHLGDWISLFLSQLHGVDILDSRIVDYLKTELSKV